MGRELQKKKNKSSIRKATQKPKSKKQLLHHPLIAANWDQKQTLSQNYKRLGLAVKLNKQTGGVERKVEDVPDEGEVAQRNDSLSIAGVKKLERIDVSEARIERDPETGRILRVLDGSAMKANPLNDPLNELDSDSEDDEEPSWASLRNQHGVVGPSDVQDGGEDEVKTEVVKALEGQAKKGTRYKHKQSPGEQDFIRKLIEKHGDDYGKMARDHKINYMQRSEGDLKRRVKLWSDSQKAVQE